MNGITRGRRARWAAAAFAVYAGAIVASNWMIGHIGTQPFPASPHELPVWPGVLAPAGVWAAAVSFPARDVLQRLTPRWHGLPVVGLLAIVVGAAVSYKVSAPVIAVASGVTYLCSEAADCAAYTPLQSGAKAVSVRWFATAVVASGLVASVVDSAVFLHLAHLPADWRSAGALSLGKIWVVLAGGLAAWWLRQASPVLAVPA